VPRRSATEWIEVLLTQAGAVRAGELAAKARISRQAAQRHLARAVARGRLVAAGAGRATHYVQGGGSTAHFRWPRAVLDEARAWDEVRARVPAVAALSGNALSVFQYAFTELVNNAVDHSGSADVEVLVEAGRERLAFEVVDRGCGAFDNVRRTLGLASNLEALQELSKGKVTTRPERHAGEGLFFTSKAADLFVLESGGLRWTVDGEREDESVAVVPVRPGTRARFEAGTGSRRQLADLFAEYTDDFAFSRTRTVVKLFAVGTRFVSRSEARRLAHGLERFADVTLDFGGVEEVGQGFVDEIFRVWAGQHPRVKLRPVRMGQAVEFMVRRGLRSPKSPRGRSSS
jgi:anti-sigma regulatory factor (Ser/Thr protein kinase)